MGTIVLTLVLLAGVVLLGWALTKAVRINVVEHRRRRSLTDDQRAAERRREAASRRWGRKPEPGGSGGWMNGGSN